MSHIFYGFRPSVIFRVETWKRRVLRLPRRRCATTPSWRVRKHNLINKEKTTLSLSGTGVCVVAVESLSPFLLHHQPISFFMGRSLIPRMPTPSTTTTIPSEETLMNSTSMTRMMQDEAPMYDNLPSSSSSTTRITTQREFYVVQRCWYSGPRQDVAPVDYLRLLESREEAQEAAFHSAMAWSGLPSDMIATVPVCNHHHHQDHPTDDAPVVETTMAYAACGSLFWIRRVMAANIVVENTNDHHRRHYQHEYQYHQCHYQQQQQQQQQQRDHHRYQHYHHSHHEDHLPDTNLPSATATTTAYAVLTEGVIGGTGNRNSRRGVEVSKGRIFLGPPMVARSAALQVARDLQQDAILTHGHQHQQQQPLHIQVVALPIGKPAEYVTKRFVQEWYHPLTSSSTTNTPPAALTTTTNTTLSSSSSSSWKRSWATADQELADTTNHHMNLNATTTTDPKQPASWILTCPTTTTTTSTTPMDTYLYPPKSKRPRRCGASPPLAFHGVGGNKGMAASPGSDDEATMDMTLCWS